MIRNYIISFLVLSFIFGFFLNLQADGPSIGKAAPDFTLLDSYGKKHTLSEYKGKFVVLEWFNPDCPFVKRHYASENMQKLQEEYTKKDVIWLIINSSAPGKQGHCTPELANRLVKEKHASPTAFLLDHEGEVGKKYGAKTTPHMFVINPKGILIYNGAIDDKPSAKKEDTAKAKNYVRMALDESMAGEEVSIPTTQPYGCSVKYK